ncbi:nucleotidyltransferase domain-containing protein [Paenibacillus thalictri]|uniref:Nucleotidyltransferase domain-containing protein n=1 Tax=Paenibacillus thalictri TaxID=2527873 RepID=A0A4Q9DVC5_9BACL|nr:nucleotidyltransferase domain-containing protein [Paenibacillus thalictri]TBL78931.1 nucleotidyltransferase domain-containing protein [Paenibacillus thalictri]
MDANPIIADIINHLKQISGVRALVLGGSRARGNDTPESDIDIGIYYDSGTGLDISGLRQAAAEMDDEHRDDLVTELGGWGPWINGGGWLKVSGKPVDLLFRDLGKVSKVMDQCTAGEITIDYQPGHPHGFVNSIYFAEIALCKVLWDPSGIIGELKTRTVPYSSAMQKSTIQTFFWEAAFSLDIGHKGVYKKDISYVAGCCFRAISCLNQALFALNETYWMNEKGAVAIAGSFPLAPSGYSQKVNNIFSLLTEEPDGSSQALMLLRELIDETGRLSKL